MPFLHEMRWPEVEHYLRTSAGIIVPIGSTEQHGPNGVIGTDALCAEGICRHAEPLAGFLVAPVLPYAPAGFNMAFAGTVSVRAATLMAIVEDVVTSLARSGFGSIYFLNGHGANVAPVLSAFHDLHERFEPQGIRLRLESWWALAPADALRRARFGEREGLHATPSEVAIVQALDERARRPASGLPFSPLSPDDLKARAGDRHEGARAHRDAFPDGRVGSDPDAATPVIGSELLDAAARGLAADYQAWMASA